MAPDAKPVVRRSRTGCAECRRRRRRCDEKKPSCGGCLLTGHPCKYLVELSWGGRPFSRSIFGQCLDSDDGVAKIAGPTQSTARQPFVYGTKTVQKILDGSSKSRGTAAVEAEGGAPDASTANNWLFVPGTDSGNSDDSDEVIELIRSSPETVSDFNSPTSRALVPRLSAHSPSSYGWILPQYRGLLEYFTKMTRSISCFPCVQDGYCSTLLPIAQESPPVLSALLYLAACHKTNRDLPQSPFETDRLRSASLRQLRIAIAAPGASAPAKMEAALAATLTLCVADIVSAVAQPGSWRIHMEGALTLWAHLVKSPMWNSRKDSDSIKFLERWYTSFEVISSGCGIKANKRFKADLGLTYHREEEDFIDDMMGFSTALYPVLNEVNQIRAARIVIESRRQQTDLGPREILTAIEKQEANCQILLERLENMLANPTRRFREGVGPLLNDTIKEDYYSVDEGYHRMAVLQIYACFPRKVPAFLVKISVTRILDVITSMVFKDEPCPAVAVLPPLFVAGSQAWEIDDQDKVLKILDRMEECWGMGNVAGSRSMLAQIWELQAQRKEKGPLPWEFVLKEDILPY